MKEAKKRVSKSIKKTTIKPKPLPKKLIKKSSGPSVMGQEPKDLDGLPT